MAINEKWKGRITILALIVLSVFIFFLTFRNDCRYNEVRRDESSDNAVRDSLAYEQRDIIASTLNKVTVRLDSMYSSQKGDCEIVIRDMDTIKQSLNQISRTGRQILNSTK